MKTCKTCGQQKSPRDFYANASQRDGKQHECMSCSRAYQRARYARLRAEENAALPWFMRPDAAERMARAAQIRSSLRTIEAA